MEVISLLYPKLAYLIQFTFGRRYKLQALLPDANWDHFLILIGIY
jgi:hypothetical protein